MSQRMGGQGRGSAEQSRGATSSGGNASSEGKLPQAGWAVCENCESLGVVPLPAPHYILTHPALTCTSFSSPAMDAL